VCCFPSGVSQLFPGDAMLGEINAESYAGATLFDSRGQPFGLIAVVGRKPMVGASHVEGILRLVAVRAAAELERAQAEAALRASEGRLRALFDISPDPITVSDLTGKFTLVNRATLDQLGFESLEALQATGLRTYDAIAEEDRERAIRNAMVTLQEGAVRNIEYRLRTRDGSPRYTEISAATLRDSEGQPVAFIGISHDVTARKQAEEAVARALAEKSTMLRDLQHRIKNSLTLITSLISLEHENAQQPETRAALNEIYDRVNSLAKLYSILYESENLNQVYLDQYLEQVAQSLDNSYQPGRRGVRILRTLEPILIDARQATPLGLIVNELLTNALKYAFPGGRSGTIWLDVSRTGDCLRLEVRDNGVGLPQVAQDQNCIHGLGLQLVELLVRQLRGKFICLSGEQTEFLIEVPAEQLD